VGPKLVLHLLVGEIGERSELLQVREVEAGMTCGLNRRHVVAGSLDVNGGDLLSQGICVRALDGSVASAVQDQGLRLELLAVLDAVLGRQDQEGAPLPGCLDPFNLGHRKAAVEVRKYLINDA